MCDYSRYIKNEGIKEGIEIGTEKGIKKGKQSGILISLRNLIDSTGMKADAAMQALKIPDSEHEVYMELLEK